MFFFLAVWGSVCVCFAMLDTKRLLLFCVFPCGLLLFCFSFLSYSSIAISWFRWMYIYQRSVVRAFESSRVVLRCGQWRETVRVIISFADRVKESKNEQIKYDLTSQWSRALFFAIVLLVTLSWLSKTCVICYH